MGQTIEVTLAPRKVAETSTFATSGYGSLSPFCRPPGDSGASAAQRQPQASPDAGVVPGRTVRLVLAERQKMERGSE